MDDEVTLINPTNGNEYLVRKELGCGTFSTVYEAIRKQDGKIFAVKTPDEEKDNKKFVRKVDMGKKKELTFLQMEMEIMSYMFSKGMQHPNIVWMEECFQNADGTLCLVLELCHNGSLGDEQEIRDGRYKPNVPQICNELVSALWFCEMLEVLHCDIKPQNVLVKSMPGGRVRFVLADFGLSHFLQKRTAVSSAVGGTGGYQVPQSQFEEAPFKVDAFSMALTVYVVLYCGYPFKYQSGAELVQEMMLNPDRLQIPPAYSCEPHTVKQALNMMLLWNVRQRVSASGAAKVSLTLYISKHVDLCAFDVLTLFFFSVSQLSYCELYTP
jgi:serine/threonine protein kinase